MGHHLLVSILVFPVFQVLKWLMVLHKYQVVAVILHLKVALLQIHGGLVAFWQCPVHLAIVC